MEATALAPFLPYIFDLLSIAIGLGIPLLLAGPLTWAERRQSAMIQDRVGPNRAPFPFIRSRNITVFGLLHPLADVIKLITKEDTINREVDRFLYNLAPIIAVFPALVTFAIVPFGPDVTLFGQTWSLQVARVDAGLLFLFAMSSLAVFGTTLAGYASANKFAMLGALRASAQMISYEVTLGLSVIGLIMVFGTLEPSEFVLGQGAYLFGGWIPKWGILVQPLGLIIFMTASIAENKRTPFDLVEGESEIIGYFVEYSGMKFGMFFMAEYIEIVVISGVVTTLFLGGWQVPFLMDGGFVFPWGASFEMAEWLVTLLRFGAFLFKVIFLCWFQLMVRWTLPRFRYDQVMKVGWRMLLPLSLLNVIVTAIWMLY